MIRRILRSSWPGVALLVGGSLLLAGCTTGSVTATGTGTPATTTTVTTTATTVAAPGSAADILNHAKAAQVKDAKFTIAVTAGSPTSNVATANGTGVLTTTPERTDISFSSVTLSVGPINNTSSAEFITDASSGIYVKVPALSQWVSVPSQEFGAVIGTVDFLHYDQLQSPTLVGTETVNGFTTYHIQGLLQSLVGAGGTNTTVAFVEDLWLRQSDYYPIKVQDQNAASVAGTPTATAATTTPTTDNRKVVELVTFNAWNTGATITLPTGVIGG